MKMPSLHNDAIHFVFDVIVFSSSGSAQRYICFILLVSVVLQRQQLGTSILALAPFREIVLAAKT